MKLSVVKSEVKSIVASSLNDEPEDENQCIRFDIIKTFDCGYWIMCFDSLMTYAIYYAFTTYAADLLQNDFNYDENLTGVFMTIQYPMVVILTPLIGFLCDRFGMR
jgi:nitrate/nitrite transporter NarK